jgi:hypothetical protein
VCHPNTPNPNALPFSAERTEFSNPFKFLAFWINSERTPSKNQVAVYTKSVSFHSSYLAKFKDDKQHTNECDSSVCK